MAIFTADWSDRIDSSLAQVIVNDSNTYLGQSSCDCSCYWSCYKHNNQYYIGLNDEYDLWLADLEDIELYHMFPVFRANNLT